MRHRIAALCILLAGPVFAGANDVKLACWIVGNDGGNTAFTSDGVSNLVQGVNEIYSQVVLTFVIDSIFYGDVFGLHYTNSLNSASHTWDRVWFLDNAPVGFGIHGSRNPTSE